ncbi:hypothetical protein [Enterococcus faecalis]|uniref:hypothetical protein n=1 Tax=Enterococcus faecalis TaxID=1351 RepID=UPI002DB95E98|nr:hypothetical protein [Enterococcus faecalis]MEB7774854.1 hypothetical protein [Enterococcus faecalis]
MDIVLPIKVTELGVRDFYFESLDKSVELYGTGESLGEALNLAKTAAEFSLFDMFEEGIEFPVFDKKKYSSFEKESSANEFFTLINTNLQNVLEKFGDETVKKTISIPKYQEHYLARKGISLSKYVQNNIERDLQANM